MPTINVMYMGFYPVPSLSQFNSYFDWVNTLDNTVIGIGVNNQEITTSAEYYPHVDMFCWKFDEVDIVN
jgi:hypothetical protein